MWIVFFWEYVRIHYKRGHQLFQTINVYAQMTSTSLFEHKTTIKVGNINKSNQIMVKSNVNAAF